MILFFFFFSSRRRHTRSTRDWSSDVCSSDLKDWRKGLKLLRPGGRLVALGFANLARVERRNPARVVSQALATPLLTPLQLMAHNRTVSGVHLGRLWGEAAVLREEFQAVLALWEAGRIK